MEETFVRLTCPECSKAWESSPGDLPGARADFECPGCRATRATAEFMRTEHDLETLKSLG